MWLPRTPRLRSIIKVPARRSFPTLSKAYQDTSSTKKLLHNKYQPFLVRPRNLKNDWYLHPELEDHINTCLQNVELSEQERRRRDSGMSLVFLGTGAGKPSLQRSNPCIALHREGETLLFDAGEGAQVQLMLSRIKPGDVRKIFISHLHGDHIFGLPGLLLSLQEISKRYGKGNRRKIQIYGPPGLYNYIAVSLNLSASELRHITVEVYELCRDIKSIPPISRPRREFRHRGLFYKRILPDEGTGVWTVEHAEEVQSPEDAVRLHSRPRGLYIYAAPVVHTPNVQALGFVVSEPETLERNVDIEKARALGVEPSEKYKILKSGFAVSSDADESIIVDPKDVLLPATRRPRKVAYLGDCCQVPAAMGRLCHKADIVVHEATLLETETGQKSVAGGHSTAKMAGTFADRVQSAVLMLTHISSSQRGDDVTELVREAEAVVRGTTKVQLAYDFLEVPIPTMGFHDEDKYPNEQEEEVY